MTEDERIEFIQIVNEAISFGTRRARRFHRGYDVRYFAAALWQARPAFGWSKRLRGDERELADKILLDFMIAVQGGNKLITSRQLVKLAAMCESLGEKLVPVEDFPLPTLALS